MILADELIRSRDELVCTRDEKLNFQDLVKQKSETLLSELDKQFGLDG